MRVGQLGREIAETHNLEWVSAWRMNDNSV
jgi:hypothetical protein